MTSLYLDAHVPAAIAAELRRRGVAVLIAQEDGATELEDGDLLVRASSLGVFVVHARHPFQSPR